MQGGRSKAQKDKPEGPSHTLEPGWACSCSLPPRAGASEDPLERPPNLPLGEVGATVGGATSCGVLPNCSQVAQMEEFLIATAKDPNNECPTPK